MDKEMMSQTNTVFSVSCLIKDRAKRAEKINRRGIMPRNVHVNLKCRQSLLKIRLRLFECSNKYLCSLLVIHKVLCGDSWTCLCSIRFRISRTDIPILPTLDIFSHFCINALKGIFLSNLFYTQKRIYYSYFWKKCICTVNILIIS